MKDFLKLGDLVQFVDIGDVDVSHLEIGQEYVNQAYNNKDCRIYADYRELFE